MFLPAYQWDRFLELNGFLELPREGKYTHSFAKYCQVSLSRWATILYSQSSKVESISILFSDCVQPSMLGLWPEH